MADSIFQYTFYGESFEWFDGSQGYDLQSFDTATLSGLENSLMYINLCFVEEKQNIKF